MTTRARQTGETIASAYRGRYSGTRWYIALFIVSAVAIGLHLVTDSPWLLFLTMAIVVAATLAMIAGGLRRHRPARPLPWYLLALSAILFSCGSILRDAVDGGMYPVDDVCTLLGYLGLVAAALTWLRPRRISGNYDLVLDSVLIGLGALLAAWTFLVSPILRAHGDDTYPLLAATYPLLDTVLLALVAHSIATTTRSEISLRLLHAGLIAVLLGDLGYSLDAAGTMQIDNEMLGSPLLAAYALVGLAALHPTMASLGALRRIHPHRSRQRASVMAVALIVASLVPVVGSSLQPLDRIVVSSLFALMLTGVLVRSERAIVRSVRSEKAAQYQADHDMLTGLLNRSALLRAPMDNAAAWTGQGQPVCLLFIDLDGFKMVNDSYGHAVGDELIAHAGSRIRRVVREEDIVARYGGDEFVVLTRLDRTAAAELAERLIGAFMPPFTLSAGQVPITASVGLACGRRGGMTSVHDLIRDADSAMYRAKEDSLGYAFHRGGSWYDEGIMPGNQVARNRRAVAQGLTVPNVFAEELDAEIADTIERADNASASAANSSENGSVGTANSKGDNPAHDQQPLGRGGRRAFLPRFPRRAGSADDSPTAPNGNSTSTTV